MIFSIGNTPLSVNGNLLGQGNTPPPGPVLPPYTIRLKFMEGVTPTFSKGTGVRVSSSPNIWDLTYENPDWSQLLELQHTLLEVVDSNTAGVIDMYGMFMECGNLTAVPLLDTSSVRNMSRMFYCCWNVQSGALALYRQASTQASPPSNYMETFRNCGVATITGAAELAQIPDDWK